MLFCIFFSYSQENTTSLRGYELCDSIYNFLRKEGFKPVTQALIKTGSNSCPYNIILSFPAKNNSSENLIINFQLEDFYALSTTILETAETLRTSDFDFNVIILLSYGDVQIVQKKQMLFGTEVFIQEQSSYENFSTLLINTKPSESFFTANSQNIISPQWMLKNLHKSWDLQNLPGKLPGMFLSHIHKNNFYINEEIGRYLSNNIPAVQLNTNNILTSVNLTDQQLSSFIIEFTEQYSKTNNKSWDQHSHMFTVFNHRIWITETFQIQIIIVICFILILLFFGYTISSRNISHKLWKKLKNVWYLPVAVFILIFSFSFIGKELSVYISKTLNFQNKIFFLFLFQASLVFIVIFSLFVNQIHFNEELKVSSLDFQLIILNFINLIVFSMFDITLFIFFAVPMVISILSYTIRLKTSRTFSFIISFIILIPYIIFFMKYSDILKAQDYFLSSRIFILCCSLILTPILLHTLRILTFLKKERDINVFSFIEIMFFLTMIILFLFSFNFSKKLKESENNTVSTLIVPEKYIDSPLINFEYEDSKIFNDTVRTLFIVFKDQPVQCDITVQGQNSQPILYSDNDFYSNNNSSQSFYTTYYPPKELIFTYGTTAEPTEITITGIFEGKDKNTFRLQQHSFTIEE